MGSIPARGTNSNRGVAQSGLARSVWDAEVGGSNPLAPTILKRYTVASSMLTRSSS